MSKYSSLSCKAGYRDGLAGRLLFFIGKYEEEEYEIGYADGSEARAATKPIAKPKNFDDDQILTSFYELVKICEKEIWVGDLRTLLQEMKELKNSTDESRIENKKLRIDDLQAKLNKNNF